MAIMSLLRSALAGLLATAPMTAFMELLFYRLPVQEQYPLPPSQITTKVTADMGMRDNIDRSQHVALTLLAHFGYGAAAGAAYAPLMAVRALPAGVKGILFGLLVWSGSYLGLLPALRILPPATEHPWRRNLLMIAAHIVWGGTLGVLAERLRGTRE